MTEFAAIAERASARDVARQRAIGLGLAGAIIGAWLTMHVGAVVLLDLGETMAIAALAVILLQTWLSVGLFIVAHDAMHGSLAPFWPRVNRWVGRIALALYAGFSYDRLAPKHFAHHRHAGTDRDPDFDVEHPRAFWPWFRSFFLRYVGLTEIAVLAAATAAYTLFLGVDVWNLVLFWALPSLLAAAQLFYFGTYRPHRHGDEPFSDRHRSRSDDLPEWLSLLTCFHFGYHHEHHEAPRVPWWRLPEFRRERGR